MSETTKSGQTELVPRADSSEMLRSISLGVGILLWLVLVHTLIWPIAAIISGAFDKPLIAYGTLTWAAVIAMAVALILTRFVFPVTYTSTGESDSST